MSRNSYLKLTCISATSSPRKRKENIMHSFIKESDFFADNSPEKIAETYGTPVYVYNEKILRAHISSIAKAITKYPYRASFSVKANTNIHILKIALEEGNNCDVMSVGETIEDLMALF